MIKKEEVYKIGRLGKPHGIQGEVSFFFDDDIFDRMDTEYLVLDREGILVPFYIDSYRFRNGTLAFVKFRDIDTMEQAAQLNGSGVYFPKDLAMQEDEGPILAFLVGFDIIDAQTGKKVGAITAVNDQTANILFELEDGKLIPANDELIRNIDTEHEVITMTLPDGLLEI